MSDKPVPVWAAIATMGWNLLGAMMEITDLVEEKTMCMKNGCKQTSKYERSLVKAVALVLCQEHEAALDRVPEIRQLYGRRREAEGRANAHIMAGRADDAVLAIRTALAAEEELFAAALVWSLTPDVVTGPVDEPEVPPVAPGR
jgi:hypothetical protein